MAKRKINHVQGKRIHYRLNHPLIGEKLRFDSWMTLCEYVMDVAEEEAEKRLLALVSETISSISDEIIATAEECEPDA